AGGTYFGADLLALWLDEPDIATLLPWLSLVLLFNGVGMVPIALFRRELRFRTLAACNISGKFAGAVCGIAMAVAGFGAWSLVGQQLLAAIATNVAVAVAARWRPRLRFSLPYLRDTGRFGFHVSASQVVSGVGEQALNLLVGAVFG